ncbi:MAG: agmatine deiminase family protein [Silvibacterium sp.]|nr:agmatine deiminase family protein [Silvibacterium sp.]
MTPADPGGTPREHGFHMPAEWARHAATWIAWPHNTDDWPGKFQAIPWVYADIVRYLSAAEDVHILVNDASVEKRARRVLTRSGVKLERVRFHQWPTNRGWMRDSGPIFVKNAQGKSAITNWKFNAWAKYDDWQLDDQVPDHVAALLEMPQWKPTVGEHRVVLEGGSIDTNGVGVLLTTEECLLSDVQQRNAGLSREGLERVFQNYLGIEQVIWLNRGIAGDDTHGHVDDITRFVGENRIVTAIEPNREDENYEPLQENLHRLRTARNLDGKEFEIMELPMPAPLVFDGRRLPASYANFYIANDLVLVPTFNDPNDRNALSVLADVFPERTVIGIHCGDLIWGLGALHCMTQQQPF